jgi:hypothetical protein
LGAFSTLKLEVKIIQLWWRKARRLQLDMGLPAMVDLVLKQMQQQGGYGFMCRPCSARHQAGGWQDGGRQRIAKTDKPSVGLCVTHGKGLGGVNLVVVKHRKTPPCYAQRVTIEKINRKDMV